MNEEAIQTLYGIAVGEGYADSIEEFRILLHTNPNAFSQMYSLARKNGYRDDERTFAELVGTDPNKPEFANIFNPQPTLKKKEPTELPSEDISLDLQSNEYDPVEQARQLTQRQGMAQVPVEVGTFESLAEGITPELISMDQDEAIEALRKQYSPYGLIFEAAGPGYDAVLVSNADGSRTEQIRLDPFTNAGMMRSEQQLKDFIAKEARNPSAPMYESDLTKALSAKNSRTAARKNEDGSVSSHLMMSYEEDGVYKVVPTLFPVDPNNQDDNPNSWIELPPESAIRLAEARGEVYEFYNEEEAQKFAEGAWKLANTIDLEGQQFFAERGLDYNTIKTAREEYDRLSDAIDFQFDGPFSLQVSELLGVEDTPIIGGFFDFTQEMLETIGFFDTDYINELEEKRDALYGVISDEAATEALEDWDRYLHNRSEQIASAAIADSKSVGSTIGLLDNISQQELGMPVDLLEYAGTEQGDAAGLTIPEGKVDLAKALSAEYKAQKQNLEIASLAYDLGSQYFDEKTTKEIRGEFVDNWEGFTNAIKIGAAEGEAGALLTEFAMFGSFASPEDLTEEEKRDLAFKIATKKYEASQTAPSAVAVRSRNARSWGEWWNAVSNDPFEWMTQLAAQSLTQQLQMVDVVLTNPTFATIIGADISLRAAQGAGIIGTATAGTGTAVGGVLGGAEGAIESLALTTGFAMEYVSSIFEVAAEKGYDMTNPDDVYKALAEDASVWEEGGQRGVDRGVPITIVSYLGGRLAGNVVKTTPLDSPITRIAAQTTERATFDPATEGLGELVAQINAGQEINWVEIAAEAGGGMGTNAPMAGVRIMYDGMFDTNSKLSKNLQSTSYVNRLSASDEKIVNWTNKMTKSGVVTEEEGKVITDNVSRRREAQKIIDAQKELEGRKFSRKQEESVRGRVMQLLDMRQTIDNVSESSSDVSGFYSGLQRQITEEIQEIIQTGKLSESPVELLDAVKKREEQFGNFGFVNRQTGEEEELTRDEFLKRIDETSSEDLIAQMEGGVVPFVRGAPETQKILFKKLLNAIQEPGPTEVDARQPAESSPSVGEEVQVTEEEVVQEIEPIRTATKAIKEAYADNTLEPETLDGLLSHIAEKEEQGKALTPFQVTLKNDNQQRLDEIATLRMQAKQEADIQSEVDVLESIVEGLNVSKSRQQISTKEQNTKDDLITRSKNALTAIRTILPDVSIVIHETNEGYNKNVTRNGQNTNGEYNPNTKVIHLNNELINQSGAITTVGHEVFHALVLDAIVNDEQARVLAKNLLNDVKNSVGKRSEIYKRIVDFQERYKDFKDEESLAEFFGILSAYETELPKSVRQKIVDFFNEILKLTGLDKVFKFDNSDIAAIMQSLATKVATGEEITAEEISPISRARERAASKGGKKILGSRQQLSKLYDVARKYNMNTAGFTPRQIDGRAFAQEVRALGYEVRRAKNGSLYIANPDGRGAFNVIEQFDKQRQADLRADRAAREEVAQEERASELSQREREISAADENAELAAFARLDDQYLETANNLMARSQLASDFTANEIRDFADRGIVSHFAPTNIVEFQPDYISRTLWGYGFYFTNSLKAAQGYGERVTFVDVSDFNILDLDESFENHIDDLATFIENAIAALPEERREEVQFVYDETIKNIENRPSWRALDWGSLFINTPKPNNDYTKIITDYVASLGYDAFALSELDYSNTATFGRNIWTVFNFEKLNDNIVSNPRAIQPRQQLGPEGIDPEAVRRKNRPGGKVSKGLSVKSVKGEKVVEESADLSLDFVKKNAPQAYVKNANIIANYPIVRGSQTFDDITTVEEADKVYSVYSDIVADNLEWLVSNYGKQFVDISKLWYDGANQIANNIADNNPVTVEQAAGIIAALSPQNDWYQNVRAAELLVETFNIDPVMTKAMLNYQSNYAKGKIDEKKKAVKKQMDALKGSRKKADKTKRESIRKAFQKVEEKERKIMAALEGLLGKRMSEVDPMFNAYYVRLYNEVNTTKDFQIIRPDGLKGDFVTTQAGKRRRFGWGSYTEIGKAVSIYLDGSMENITAQLGENHKIRNFHNNIVDPMSEDKDITMDTHAIAAALLIPAASNTTEVKQNFGNPAASSNVGQKGLYYANQEGYFKAAERLGMLPREVQSITWEAVRGLFTDTFKKDKKKSNEIYKVWNDYANKEITIDEARERVLELADGVNDPSWAGLISTEPRSDVRGEAIARRGEADGRDTEREGITPRQQKAYPSSPQEAVEEGYLVHASGAFRESFDPRFIRGKNRTELGALGFYFSNNDRKAMDYGSVYTYIDPSNLNLLNLDEITGNRINSFIDQIERGGNQLLIEKQRLIALQNEVRSNREYNEIEKEIKSIDAQIESQSPFGSKPSSQARLLSELKKAKGNDLIERYREAENKIEADGRKSDADAAFSDLLYNAGYDGMYEGPGIYKAVIFNIDKLNESIVQPGITPRQQKQIEREMKEENGMLNIIQTGRQANISEEAIRRVLAAKGFPKVEIDAALAVPIDAFTTIPPAFNKVEGGLNESMNLFTEVTDGIRKFMKPRKVRGKDEYTQPTKAEVREKALKLLGDNPIYKEQPRQVQDELMLAVDRMVGTRANKEVQKQISEIRNNLKQRKMATRDLAANQRQLKNFIRENLVGLPDVTISDVNRLINAIDKAKTAEEYIAQATKVLDITDRRRATYQKQLIKEIAQFVIRKGAAKILDSGKRKAPGIDNETRLFFEAAAPILRAAVKGDIDAIAQAAQLLEQNPDLQAAINKELNQENMTLKERKLVNQSIAMSTFGNINNMSVEELLELMNELKSIRKDSIARMKANKLERAKRYAANDEAATIQIRQLFPFLFNEDGSLKDENQLKREKKTIYQRMNEGKVFAGIKDFYEKSSLNTVKGVMKFAGRLLSNLQTITTLLDNEAKGQNFFTETIYKPLARMSENQRRGVFDQQAVLDQIANTIDGVTDGYKQIRSALLIGPVEITLKNGSVDVTSGNQLARIYALSLNEVQARKLEAAGYGPEQLAQVEAALPEEVKQFVEKTVDYLSNTYFETVNDVYESLNDVSLGYVENYFPTRTLSDPSSASIDFKDGKFLDSISTENESALKERTDTTRPVSTEAMFTDVLDLYLDSMERYKAYAEGARTLSKVFATPAVNTLLQEAGIQDLMTQMVGLSINPMAGRSLIDKPMTRIIDRFMGYALAFKAIQLPKQATSFINAFQDYQYRSGKYTPGIDQIMFMYDAARIIMDLPDAIRQAYDTSAEFRYRLEQGFEGDVYGLESGATRFRRVTQNEGRFKAAKAALTGFRKAGVSPTVLGDILGVMGYMINYRRNLKNGMSKTEALEAFNEYNPTQQSRRSMDKNALQFSRSELMRAFTSFGSVLFLQYNRVVQSATNISKSIASKQKPSAKDVRALILSYALANVFYQMTGYMFALMKGDKDDEEKAMGAMRKAASGIDMISAIPLIGPAIEYAYARAKGERYYDSQITNPYLSVSKDVAKSIKEKDVADVLKTLTEISLGTNVDPLIGLYNVSEDIVTGDTISDEDFYEMLGVPPSQRPGQ